MLPKTAAFGELSSEKKPCSTSPWLLGLPPVHEIRSVLIAVVVDLAGGRDSFESDELSASRVTNGETQPVQRGTGSFVQSFEFQQFRAGLSCRRDRFYQFVGLPKCG